MRCVECRSSSRRVLPSLLPCLSRVSTWSCRCTSEHAPLPHNAMSMRGGHSTAWFGGGLHGLDDVRAPEREVVAPFSVVCAPPFVAVAPPLHTLRHTLGTSL